MNQLPRQGAAPGMTNRKELEYYHSVRILAASAALTNQTFFRTVNGMSDKYQNLTLPSPNNQQIVIHALSFDYNAQFTGASAAAQAVNQQSFERFSVIRWRRGRVGSTEIPVSQLLPYQLVSSIGVLGQYNNFKKWFELKSPIVVPPGGDFTIELIVQDSLTLHATQTAFLPNSGQTLSSNLGAYFSLQCWATKEEPLA